MASGRVLCVYTHHALTERESLAIRFHLFSLSSSLLDPSAEEEATKRPRLRTGSRCSSSFSKAKAIPPGSVLFYPPTTRILMPGLLPFSSLSLGLQGGARWARRLLPPPRASWLVIICSQAAFAADHSQPQFLESVISAIKT